MPKYEYRVTVPTNHNMNHLAEQGFRVVPGSTFSIQGGRVEVLMEREIPDPVSATRGSVPEPNTLYPIGEAAWLEPEGVDMHLPRYLQVRLAFDEQAVMQDIGEIMSGYLLAGRTPGELRDFVVGDGTHGYRSLFGLVLQEACKQYAKDNPMTESEYAKLDPEARI